MNGWSKWFFFSVLAGMTFLEGLCKQEVYEGSKCHNRDAPGTCTTVTNCPLALIAIREHRFSNNDFKRCGFQGKYEIVCCPQSDSEEDEHVHLRGVDPIRKCESACKKYSKNIPILLSYHIVGGEDAEAGEFPHMAALAFHNKETGQYHFECGGTLISHEYIVTAAHCIINSQGNELKFVRLGVVNVPEAMEEPDPNLDFEVINITVHKDYKWKEKYNDIALAKLGKKVTFSDKIRPACLYTKNDDPARLTVTGWGAVTFGGERSSKLQKAVLNPVTVHGCNSTYQTVNKNILRTQICAADDNSDACQGDSGGPLQIQSNTTIAIIVGVTSYGVGCSSKFPGIYTRISSYLEWIEKIVWP